MTQERFFIRSVTRSVAWSETTEPIYISFFAGQMSNPNGKLKTNFRTGSGWDGRIVRSETGLLLSDDEFFRAVCMRAGANSA